MPAKIGDWDMMSGAPLSGWSCPSCGQHHNTTCCPRPLLPEVQQVPFKCPVCNGGGKVFGGFETGTVPQADCHACTGTGIVWGPPR